MPLNWEHPRWQSQDGADLFEKLYTDLLRSLGFKNVDWRKGDRLLFLLDHSWVKSSLSPFLPKRSGHYEILGENS